MPFCENCSGLGCSECWTDEERGQTQLERVAAAEESGVRGQESGVEKYGESPVLGSYHTLQTLSTLATAAIRQAYENTFTPIDPRLKVEAVNAEGQPLTVEFPKGSRLCRRRKIFRVRPQLILEVLNGLQAGAVLRLQTMHIPEDARVVDLREDFRSNSLELIVEHPYFDDVADGAELPVVVDWNCQLKQVARLVDVPDPYF